ncbi:MAG TPA: integration host factor, actinobacterial type [Solirubrobacteraceae bacterium]|jgi:hypothetical protein|nr:integration host factor, actinobacterial type [Solirubrobacteraceae bacterium]
MAMATGTKSPEQAGASTDSPSPTRSSTRSIEAAAAEEMILRQVPAPERSLNQRLDALARANLIRSRRAELKRDLKSGRLSIHKLLLDPPDYVATAKVFDMMLAVPKYGRVKVNKMLAQCRIAPSKTIGGLSERQRTELVALLRRR